jgi:tetratricopeptide (TPR) repeat protein
MEENFGNINEEAITALNRYQEMLKLNKKYYFDIYEFEHIADYYIDIQDIKRAEDLIEYALEIHPGTGAFLLKKAQILISKSKHFQALKLLNKLARVEVSNSNVFFLLGIVYTSLGELNKALSNYNKAVSLEYEDVVDLLTNIASTLQQIGHYGFARDFYEKAYQEEPENSTVLFELAYCSEKIDNDRESIKFYKAYLSEDPFSKLAWYNMGNVYHKIDNYERAIEALSFAIAIDPKYHHAIYQKALNEIYNEDYEKGIATFNEYLEFEPDSASAFFHIGEAYAKLENNKEALSYFEKTLELDDMYADAFYGQAYTLFAAKKYTDAYYSIKKAIKLEPEDPDFWHLSALINQKLGFENESEKAFKTALDIESSDPQIWIDYSNLLDGRKNLFKKINILSEAFEHLNDNAEINYRLAANLALISNVDSAVYHLKKALKTEPDKLDIFRSIYPVKNSTIEDLIDKFKLGEFNFECKN